MNITYAQFCTKTGFSTDPKEQRPLIQTAFNINLRPTVAEDGTIIFESVPNVTVDSERGRKSKYHVAKGKYEGEEYEFHVRPVQALIYTARGKLMIPVWEQNPELLGFKAMLEQLPEHIDKNTLKRMLQSA